MNWRTVEKAAQIFIAAAVVYFLADVVRSSWTQLLRYTFRPEPLLLVGAAGAILLAYGLIWFRWYLTLHALDEPVSVRTAGAIYAFFQLSTYIPGGVWQYMQLTYLAQKADLSKANTAAAMLQHQILGIIGAGAVFAAFGGAAFLPYGNGFLVPLLLAGIIATAAYPPLIERAINPVLERIGRDPLEIRIPYSSVAALVLVSTTSWLITAGGFVLLVQAFTGIGFQPLLIAVFPGAWLTGFLLLLAPGGLGIRETALIAFMELFTGRPEAIIIAGVSRLWTILPEAVFGGIFLFIESRKPALRD